MPALHASTAKRASKLVHTEVLLIMIQSSCFWVSEVMVFSERPNVATKLSNRSSLGPSLQGARLRELYVSETCCHKLMREMFRSVSCSDFVNATSNFVFRKISC